MKSPEQSRMEEQAQRSLAEQVTALWDLTGQTVTLILTHAHTLAGALPPFSMPTDPASGSFKMAVIGGAPTKLL